MQHRQQQHNHKNCAELYAAVWPLRPSTPTIDSGALWPLPALTDFPALAHTRQAHTTTISAVMNVPRTPLQDTAICTAPKPAVMMTIMMMTMMMRKDVTARPAMDAHACTIPSHPSVSVS